MAYSDNKNYFLNYCDNNKYKYVKFKQWCTVNIPIQAEKEEL